MNDRRVRYWLEKQRTKWNEISQKGMDALKDQQIADAKKPANERYCHRYIANRAEYAICAVPELMSLIHHVSEVYGDTTFKIVQGSVNMYDFVIIDPFTQQSEFQNAPC